MTNYDVKFELSYSGNDSDNHEIDMYDASQSLISSSDHSQLQRI
ncbi:MAG: hypothetical protein Q9N32_01910 [Gammaproteobacteria bacterium]|nr:hypothetical protein [Gammaproteobacteria bacterium]